MAEKLRYHAKKWLPFVGVLLLIYLLFQLDLEKVRDSFFSLDVTLVIFSVTLTVPLLFIRVFAWRLIQQEHLIHISFFTSMKILLIGFFYGVITPGYLGQVMRIPYMKEQTKQPYGKLFVNVVLEVVVHNMSLYGMMIAGALLVVSILPDLLYVTVFWISVVSVSITFFIKKERGEGLFFWLTKQFLPKKYQQQFFGFVQSFYQDFPSIRKLVLPGFLGVFTWMIVFSQQYLISVAVGADIPYLYFLLLYPIANTAGFIPITFAGLGTRELTAVFLFSTLFSVSVEKIFVFSIIGFLITEILVGCIGFVLSLSSSRSFISCRDHADTS